MVVTPHQPPHLHAQLYVESVSIRNFRGIDSCDIELEQGLTVLVGRNNVGKSRVLSALHLALGGRVADADDFTVGGTAEPTIDVVLAPCAPASATADDAFPQDEGRMMAGNVQAISESPLRERFAWRTHVKRSAEGLGARSEARILTFDVTKREWAERSNAPELGRVGRKLIASDLVNTGRDLTEELVRRGSGIRKVLSDLDVAETQRAQLEASLLDLSEQIVQESRTLEALNAALLGLHAAVGSIGSPGITALPSSLEELSRTLSITLDSGSGSLPIRFHGAGARSLASLQVQGVFYERLLGADGGSLRPHPVTLIEEPEAHLHPQAASELPHLLGSIRGQVIASTHSSQVVTSTNPRSIRLLREAGRGITVIDLGPAPVGGQRIPRPLRPDLHTSEMEKLKRLAERPFGELLFANAVVFGDGATERGFLPPILRHALGSMAHGICVIDPESMNAATAMAAVKFAAMAGLPCVVFADSDAPGIEAVSTLKASGHVHAVVWAGKPDQTSDTGYSGAIEAMLVDFDEATCRDACLLVRSSINQGRPTLELMKDLKGSLGPTLAEVFLDKHKDQSKWPRPLQQLVNELKGALS